MSLSLQPKTPPTPEAVAAIVTQMVGQATLMDKESTALLEALVKRLLDTARGNDGMKPIPRPSHKKGAGSKEFRSPSPACVWHTEKALSRVLRTACGGKLLT